jgi:hypothetical protein
MIDWHQHETHDWTLHTAKRREGLEKQDSQDRAHSLFSLDHHGRLRPEGRVLSNMHQAPAANASANAIAAAVAPLVVAQATAIDAHVADANSAIVEADRPTLFSFCGLSGQEWGSSTASSFAFTMRPSVISPLKSPAPI